MIDLRHVDCMEYLASCEDNAYELAIVDPPYGYATKETKVLNFRQKEQHRSWNLAPPNKYFLELCRVSQNQIVWGGNYFPALWHKPCRGFIFWHKGNPVKNFADGELAWTSFDQNARQFDYRYFGCHEGKGIANPKFHPTQKPVKLYEWLLINYAKDGDRILDTHLGSGSIAIACHNLGFDLVGCELDEDYYKAACKRLAQHQAQKRMF